MPRCHTCGRNVWLHNRALCQHLHYYFILSMEICEVSGLKITSLKILHFRNSLGCMCAIACSWSSENNLWELIVSFPHMGPREGTQVIGTVAVMFHQRQKGHTSGPPAWLLHAAWEWDWGVNTNHPSAKDQKQKIIPCGEQRRRRLFESVVS